MRPRHSPCYGTRWWDAPLLVKLNSTGHCLPSRHLLSVCLTSNLKLLALVACWSWGWHPLERRAPLHCQVNRQMHFTIPYSKPWMILACSQVWTGMSHTGVRQRLSYGALACVEALGSIQWKWRYTHHLWLVGTPNLDSTWSQHWEG